MASTFPGLLEHAIMEQVARYSTGIQVRCEYADVVGMPGSVRRSFRISTSGLQQHEARLFSFMTSVVSGASMNLSKLGAALRSSLGQLESQFDRFPTGFAADRTEGAVRPASAGVDQTRGLPALWTLRALHRADAIVEGRIGEELLRTRAEMFVRGSLEVSIANDRDQGDAARFVAELSDGLRRSGSRGASPAQFHPIPLREVYQMPGSSGYYARSYGMDVPFDHADAAGLLVLGHFLKIGILHQSVREEGGAYGVDAVYEPKLGCFTFSTYRDPDVVRSSACFDEAIRYGQRAGGGAPLLERAVVASWRQVDPDLSLERRATLLSSLERIGHTHLRREAFRRRLLSTSLEDLSRLSERYLTSTPAVVALAPKPSLASVRNALGLELSELER
jgi:Zn-dependent M16 (insulinase) family peptidase